MRRLFVCLGFVAYFCAPFSPLAKGHAVFVPGKGFKTLDHPQKCSDLVRENLAPCDDEAGADQRSCLEQKLKNANIFPSSCRGEFISQANAQLRQLEENAP